MGEESQIQNGSMKQWHKKQYIEKHTTTSRRVSNAVSDWFWPYYVCSFCMVAQLALYENFCMEFCIHFSFWPKALNRCEIFSYACNLNFKSCEIDIKNLKEILKNGKKSLPHWSFNYV